MRLKNIPGAKEEMKTNPFVIREPEQYKGHWAEKVFGNDRPVVLEIGCGKGRFLSELSVREPEKNYLGIERQSSVLYRALEKRAVMDVDNLYFLCFDAEHLTDIFGEGEISRIYLNFSDPWPKDRHFKRRLTSAQFLKRYEGVLAEDAVVEFKTDNESLFDFTLEIAEEAGWEVTACTRDLHKSPLAEGNIMTEYEERFVLLGEKICKLVMKPKRSEK